MNVKMWIKQHCTTKLARRLIAPSLALALAASFGIYEAAKPDFARAAAVAPPGRSS